MRNRNAVVSLLILPGMVMLGRPVFASNARSECNQAESVHVEKPQAEKVEAEKPEVEKPEIEKSQIEKPEVEKPENEKPRVKAYYVKPQPKTTKPARHSSGRKNRPEPKHVEVESPEHIQGTLTLVDGLQHIIGITLSDDSVVKMKLDDKSSVEIDNQRVGETEVRGELVGHHISVTIEHPADK